MDFDYKKQAKEILEQLNNCPESELKKRHINKMNVILNLDEEKFEKFILKYSEDLLKALKYITNIEVKKTQNGQKTTYFD